MGIPLSQQAGSTEALTNEATGKLPAAVADLRVGTNAKTSDTERAGGVLLLNIWGGVSVVVQKHRLILSYRDPPRFAFDFGDYLVQAI